MADLAALAVILLILCVIALVGTRTYNKHITPPPHRWTIQEHATPRGIVVQLECPGELSQPVGDPIPVYDRDFDYKIEETYSEARLRLTALKSASLTNNRL